MVAAVAQLVVAIVLAIGQRGPGPEPDEVTVVAPAGSVQETEPTTTTTLPPLVVEATPDPAPAPPAPPPTVATGAVWGVIGAGPGGTARADLRDEAGNTWHSEASSTGVYRFDRLPPGRYQLILSAESAAAPCEPDGTCIGTALAISKRIIEIGPGQELRHDYLAYGPTGPPLPTTTSTTAALPTTTSTTTSS